MKKHLFRASLMLVFSFCLSLSVLASNDYMNYIEYSSLDIGGGFDFIDRSVKKSAIMPFTPVYVSDGGQDIQYTLKYVESSEDFSEALEIEADGSYDGIVNSFSARSKFMGQSDVNTYSMNFIVRVKVINGTKRIPTSSYFLSQEAKDNLAKDNDPLKTEFHKSFGDRYVSAITTGGEYVGIISIETSSIHDKMQVESEIKASGISWSANSKFKDAVERISKSHKVEVQNYIRGGRGIEVPENVSKMIELANKFPALVLNDGVLLKVELSPYTDFIEYTGSFEALPSETRFALQDLNQIYVDYLVFKNNLKYMRDHKNNYEWTGTNIDNIDKYLDQTQSKTREMQTLAENLLKGSTSPKTPIFKALKDFSRNMKLPLQKFTIYPGKFNIYPFNKHTDGDNEMDGNTPKMTITAALALTNKGRKIFANVNGSVREGKRDWTTFKGQRSLEIFNRDTMAPGYVVTKFSPLSGSLSYTFGENDHDWHTVTSNGLVKSFNGLGDTKGKDNGKLGAKNIQLAPIEVVIDIDKELYGPGYYNVSNIIAVRPKLSAAHKTLKTKQKTVTPLSWFKGKSTAPAHLNKTKEK